MKTMKFGIAVGYILIAFTVALCLGDTADDDRITYLPGIDPQPTFNQYSGYLQVSKERYLHYWFVESQGDPMEDPVVLWLNGGPGCSSLAGLLTENGPFLATPKGNLQYNPYAWNKLANVLYLEAPAGVGWSFDSSGNVTIDDNTTADQNLIALEQFFIRYPQFLRNEFYISGESYGGYYIPTLSVRALKSPLLAKNFKGILIGNGLFSFLLNDNSLLYFARYHGLFADKLWDNLLNTCCPNNKDTDVCLFSQGKDQNCAKNVKEATDIINYGLDVYNLYSPCDGGVKNRNMNFFTPYDQSQGTKDYFYLDRGLLFRDNEYVQEERNIRNILRRIKNVRDDPPCSNVTAVRTYLNDQTVKNALHIPNNLPDWEVCSGDVGDSYVITYADMYGPFNEILKSGKLRLMIYNGDVDMACNFIGDEWFFDAMKLQLTDERRAWLFSDEDKTQQVAGFTKTWQNNVTFTTIRGSGHLVPGDKPIPAYYMFRRFLQNKPL